MSFFDSEVILTIMKSSVKKLTESAVMLALATALSFVCFPSFWVFGGSVTACSMVPLVLICCKYGTRHGILVATVFGLIQMLIGMSNVQYAPNAVFAVLIILLDYVAAFGCMGLSAVFYLKKRTPVSLACGITIGCVLRFICHFISGWVIWEALFPNELGLISPIYSLFYNGSYMLPETVLTCIVSVLMLKPLQKHINE